MHTKRYVSIGKKPEEAKGVLIMIHGRGGSPDDILNLSTMLNIQDFAVVAPEATNNTWYPYSFLAPVHQNEPWLSSALSVLNTLVGELNEKGVDNKNIYFLGFSQGACLVLEFVTRHATRYGGIAALTGGLIGDTVDQSKYKGDFSGTPVFIGTSDPDPHVPVERVNESARILTEMKAVVSKKIYKGLGHTINQDEINEVNKLIFSNHNNG